MNPDNGLVARATITTLIAMSEQAPPSIPPPASPPPRAFTQGVGTVFQFVGVMLFLVLTTICCGSSLLGKDTSQRQDLARIGWHFPGDPPDQPSYSAPRAISISLFVGIFLGIALAGIGLGLQATRRSAVVAATIVTPLATAFWIVQLLFALGQLHSILLSLAAALLAILFLVLAALSLAALRDMLLHPPPPDQDRLPIGFKIPYSWYHPDPPEVRLARELDQRRQRLAVQQKELDELEEKIKREQK